MKEFRGTKGEWVRINTSNRVMIHVGEHKAICDVWGSSVSSVNHKEMIANAKLIAAAPELLEALQNCLETFKILDDTIESISDHQTYFNATRNSMEVAKNAINKAL